MGEKTVAPTVNHQNFYQDFLQLLKKHTGHLDGSEMLALSSQATGALLAMQDRNKYTPETAMKIVQKNLEKGNRNVVDGLFGLGGAPVGLGKERH